MATVIQNLGQFAKALEPKIIATLELVANDVKKEIDEALDRYYEEYYPILYERTDQLKKCCKIGNVKISNGTINIDVYLDVDSLKYSTPGANAYKTVVAANAGLHGGCTTFEVAVIFATLVAWQYGHSTPN